jgi:uncharacterized membrane protein YkvA (DUF1232 family)
MKLFEIPMYFRSMLNILTQMMEFMKFLKNLILVFWLSLLLLYIISPIDLIPELYLGLLGLIDDVLAVFLVLGIVGYTSLLR